MALNLARIVKKPPRQIAQIISDHLSYDNQYITKVEIAGAGFLNFFLSKNYLRNSVLEILSEEIHFGKTHRGAGQKVQFEFVSANPTGPLNVVSARAAAVGSFGCDWVGYSRDRPADPGDGLV